MALAYYYGFWVAWFLGILWDIGDGFKPLWTKGRGKPWLVQELLYADGMSLLDIFIFDLTGCFAGIVIYNFIGWL